MFIVLLFFSCKGFLFYFYTVHCTETENNNYGTHFDIPGDGPRLVKIINREKKRRIFHRKYIVHVHAMGTQCVAFALT